VGLAHVILLRARRVSESFGFFFKFNFKLKLPTSTLDFKLILCDVVSSTDDDEEEGIDNVVARIETNGTW